MDRRKFLEALVVSTAAVHAGESARAGVGQVAIQHGGNDSPRIRESFNSRWLFQRQSKGAGELGSFDRETGEAALVEPPFREAHHVRYDDSWWERVELPHTWNAHDVSDAKSGYWRGIGWYRKHFALDASFSGKSVFLEFEGVNSISEFWLNDQRLGRHQGGYTSFEFDVTRQVRFGDNVLTVKVDNLYHAAVPPTVKTDYNFYGGIYRDAWLRLSEPIYLAEVTWTTPGVTRESAEVQIQSGIINKTVQTAELTLVHELFDPHQRLVRSTSTRIQAAPDGSLPTQSSVHLDDPLLWSPESPNLYQIKSSLRDGDGLVDVVENPLGFRWFNFDPQKGFFLNGARLQIQGTNWHQSYPGMGNALPNSRHEKDMEMIREMGANFWRTSHYPHDPATIEASDRLGLMVWEELPVNKEIGDPDEYLANVLAMAEEMIRRDRNHPSVVLWGIAGEINASLKVSQRVVAALAQKYRQLDPTRPVAMHAPRGDTIEALVDVIGLEPGKKTDDKHLRYPRRSYMTAEYAAATIGRGTYGQGPQSEDLACRKHEEYLHELYARPWMAGGLIWHQFDYDGETYDTVMPHVVAFGMADVWRIPKDVYYFYQCQWSAKPMVHIVGHWTWPRDEGKVKSVKVYSNAEEVELFLNGSSLGAKKDSDRLALPHPPHVWDVPYHPGTLKAVARSRGAEMADERRTADVAHHILLEADVRQLKSGDRESLAYITALVVDQQGTVVPTASQAISFTSYGPGELLPQTWPGHGTGFTWNVIDGKTCVAFRATSRTGRAVISGFSPGLGMGRLEIDLRAPGKPDEMEYQEIFKEDEP
jgi:beta-galactosidase